MYKKLLSFVLTLSLAAVMLPVSMSPASASMGKPGHYPAVSLGATHHAAITANGDLYTWGDNSTGQLGHGDQFYRDTPTKVEALTDVIAVSLSTADIGQGLGVLSAAITADGKLYTWGRNYYGYGDNRRYPPNHKNSDESTPTRVEGLPNVVSASLDSGEIAVITDEGDLYTWAVDDSGDSDESTIQGTPTKVAELSNVVAASLSTGTIAAITSNGDLYTWGDNRGGQLGHGDETDRSTPTKVESLSNVVAVSLGSFFSAAVTAEGELYTWGWNSQGQLGHGDVMDRNTPARVTGLSNVVAVSLSKVVGIGTLSYGAAITANGDLYTSLIKTPCKWE